MKSGKKKTTKIVKKPSGEQVFEEKIEQWEEQSSSPRHWVSLLIALSVPAAKVLILLYL